MIFDIVFISHDFLRDPNILHDYFCQSSCLDQTLHTKPSYVHTCNKQGQISIQQVIITPKLTFSYNCRLTQPLVQAIPNLIQTFMHSHKEPNYGIQTRRKLNVKPISFNPLTSSFKTTYTHDIISPYQTHTHTQIVASKAWEKMRVMLVTG